MGAETNIDWTGATWNPWQGCHHVSSGCDNCYMFTQKRRYGQDPGASPETPQVAD
jgi:protein gp37